MIVYKRGKGLWVVPASGGRPREVVKDAGSPVWSADGKKLGFTMRDDTSISIVTLATGEVRNIVDLKALGMADPEQPSNYSWGLTWSPDGKRLSFFTVKGKIDHFWVVQAEGGKLKELASSHPGKWYQFWSPDGSMLSYNSDRDVRVRMGAIWEMDVEKSLSGSHDY
jgi:TolB protein